mgnify:CR=1 FL=1
MNRIITILTLAFSLFGSTYAYSQPEQDLAEEIKLMTKENSPAVNSDRMNQIITKYSLDEQKDSETIDMMKGIISLNYVDTGNFDAFEKTIASMQNPFNRTSYLNMAAANLLDSEKNPEKAEELAKQALDLYMKIKDDPAARPANFPEADWNRFMQFAYYPYCDTYAHALYIRGKYEEALHYQEKALADDKENGMPASIERYAQLLFQNGHEEDAYFLLAKMIRTGKSTEAMIQFFKKLYIRKQGNDEGFDEYMVRLNKEAISSLKEKLKEDMQDIPAPAFSLKDLAGKNVSLSDFKGRVVVVDFWATWCLPCKASFPAMQKVMEQHPEVKFLFIATQEFQEDPLTRVKKFITENKYPFHVLMDKSDNKIPANFQVVTAYRVEGIPTKFVIDANGRQRFSSVGYNTDSQLINELSAMIELAKEAK